MKEQHEYLRKLEEFPLDASFSRFRSMWMKLAWLSNMRPDCLFEISPPAQVTGEIYEAKRRELIRRINKAVRYAMQSRISLKVLQLEKETVKVIGFSDSSFVNNADQSSQLGHICFLGDNSTAIIPINFNSYMSRRVTRSSIAGEVIAFSDLLDVATTLGAEISTMPGR